MRQPRLARAGAPTGGAYDASTTNVKDAEAHGVVDAEARNATNTEDEATPRLPLFPLRILLLVGACASIAYGLMREEHLVILMKGVRICLECVGLG